MLGDVHWNDSGGGEDIKTKSAIKANLDTFIDDMNNNVHPPVVIQTGDLIHGNTADSYSEFLTWIDEARGYLENSGGTAGTGLDAPIYYILGNHEYEFAGSEDIQQVYDAFGMSGLSDSYRTLTLAGCTFLLTNTAYSTTDGSTADDHEIPSQEVSWIQDQLQTAIEDGTPVIPFVHIPVHMHDGGQSYDTTVNGPLVDQEFASSPNIPMGFFGHVHHGTGGWDHIREERDQFGRSWLNCPTPHHLESDESVVPYQTVMVSPSGAVTSRASYTTPEYATGWSYSLEDHTSLQYERFISDDFVIEYPMGFETLETWDTTANVSLTAARSQIGVMSLETGATTSGESSAVKDINQAYPFGNLTWDDTVALKIRIDMKTNSAQEWLLSLGESSFGDKTTKHIGIRADGPTVYASVGDGTSETSAVLETLSGNEEATYVVYKNQDVVRVDRADKREEPLAVLTSGLPTGVMAATSLFDFRIQTNENVAKRIDVASLKAYIGAEPPSMTGGF